MNGYSFPPVFVILSRQPLARTADAVSIVVDGILISTANQLDVGREFRRRSRTTAAGNQTDYLLVEVL